VGYLCGVVGVRGTLGCFMGGLDTIFWPTRDIHMWKRTMWTQKSTKHVYKQFLVIFGRRWVNLFINNFLSFLIMDEWRWWPVGHLCGVMGVEGIVGDVMRWLDVIFWPMINILCVSKAYGGWGQETCFLAFCSIFGHGWVIVVALEVTAWDR
jgi:hypothetical protein